MSGNESDGIEVGDEIEVTFRAKVTDIRGVGGHRKAVIDADGVPGGKIQIYLHDTIDGEYSENYTDHQATDVRVVNSDINRSAGGDADE